MCGALQKLKSLVFKIQFQFEIDVSVVFFINESVHANKIICWVLFWIAHKRSDQLKCGILLLFESPTTAVSMDMMNAAKMISKFCRVPLSVHVFPLRFIA